MMIAWSWFQWFLSNIRSHGVWLQDQAFGSQINIHKPYSLHYYYAIQWWDQEIATTMHQFIHLKRQCSNWMICSTKSFVIHHTPQTWHRITTSFPELEEIAAGREILSEWRGRRGNRLILRHSTNLTIKGIVFQSGCFRK